MLAGPDDGAQRFLYQDTAIEASRRVLAHVAVAAIMVRLHGRDLAGLPPPASQANRRARAYAGLYHLLRRFLGRHGGEETGHLGPVQRHPGRGANQAGPVREGVRGLDPVRAEATEIRRTHVNVFSS